MKHKSTLKFCFKDYIDFCIIMQIKPCYYTSLKEFREFINYITTN